MSTHPPNHPSTQPPIHPSTQPPIHPSTQPAIHPFTHPPNHPRKDTVLLMKATISNNCVEGFLVLEKMFDALIQLD
ncbi:hypothetical protein PoB_003336500 [Plakobranchus ocellatus]|uniref:Uncharacterized protein n=1 Tax=Plakobranchus ocellatus TaxID=259542 RepID=A0AAV4AHP1_9GAST|nr:hypothetical protein PoB_003336500 [Plakobranchus ocellatus]